MVISDNLIKYPHLSHIMLLTKRAVKEAAKKLGVRFPDGAIESLDKKLLSLIEEAAERAKKNGRVTLKEFDF